MTELQDTLAVRDLKELTKRGDKQRQHEMVSTLVGMMQPETKSKAQPANALEREMLKGASQ